jgi:ligand-binding sensor domain-containing protein
MIDPHVTCVSSFLAECASDPRTTAASLLLDGSGNIWVAGSTNEIGLPVTSDALKQSCGCSLYSGDGFLAEFSPDGSSLLYATYLGSSTSSATDQSGNDAILSAVTDDQGHIWMGGSRMVPTGRYGERFSIQFAG